MHVENIKTLLLVEDEVLIAMDESMTLEKYGYAVVMAHNGKKAIEIAGKRDDVDLILMDIDLGSGIDGTETATAILKIKETPILFLSSHTESVMVNKTEMITSYGYVVKNTGITVLDASIKMALKLFDANRKIELERDRFKNLFVEAPLGIALIDSLTGQIYKANPMYAKIAGRSVDELQNIDWMSITHPEDIQKDLDNMTLLNTGKVPGFKMEKRYILPDGAIVWVHMTIAPVIVQDKAHPRHLCMIENITDRKRVEEDLHIHQIELKMQNDEFSLKQAELDALRAKYVNLYEMAPVSYVTVSDKGFVVDANLTVASLLGVPRGDLIGQLFSRLIFNEDQDIYYFHSRRLFESYEPQSCVLRMKHLDGAVFPAYLTAVIAHEQLSGNEDHSPVCRVVIVKRENN